MHFRVVNLSSLPQLSSSPAQQEGEGTGTPLRQTPGRPANGRRNRISPSEETRFGGIPKAVGSRSCWWVRLCPNGRFCKGNRPVVAVPAGLQGGGVQAWGYPFTKVSSGTYTRYRVWVRHSFLCLRFHRSFMAGLCSWARGDLEILRGPLASCLEGGGGCSRWDSHLQ